MSMKWSFKKKKTSEERLSIYKKNLNEAVRALDKEISRKEHQEKRVIADIFRTAKKGHMDAVKIVVKDLVLTRRYVRKTIVMKAKLKSVSLHIESLLSNDAMVIAMRGLGITMQSMDTQLMLTHLKKIIIVFEQQFKMKEKEEESINEDDEDEMNVSDAIVSQVLVELGVPSTGGTLVAGETKHHKQRLPAGDLTMQNLI
ncbi:charged multivesicular body protein 2a-like [Mytilus trossulus]|uniref:charged multivesicular body protein 2a-like n=1 Tax=Mytilus trossulus TaxID=6551 RepID=UPI0030060FFD